MTAFLHLALALRLASIAPVADPLLHVEHAIAAAGDDLPVEIILAIAWQESRLTVPVTAEPHHCGVMQVDPAWVPWSCVEMRELATGYRAGAELLRRWLVLSGGRMREAIRAYRCGWGGLRSDCVVEPGYDDRVLAMAGRMGWRR